MNSIKYVLQATNQNTARGQIEEDTKMRVNETGGKKTEIIPSCHSNHTTTMSY